MLAEQIEHACTVPIRDLIIESIGAGPWTRQRVELVLLKIANVISSGRVGLVRDWLRDSISEAV